MKNYPILTSTAFLLIVMSCHKDQAIGVKELYQTWAVKNFMSIESASYPKFENKPVLLTLHSDGSYNLKLDINNCSGSVDFQGKNHVEFEPAMCTEICCDSAFSEKLVAMLPRVTSWSMEGKNLKLHVPLWGYIECELAE